MPSQNSPRIPKTGSKCKTLPSHLDQRLHTALKDLQKIKQYYHSSESPKNTSPPTSTSTSTTPEEEDSRALSSSKHASETLIKKLYERNLVLEREIGDLRKGQQKQSQQAQDGEKSQLRQQVSGLERELAIARSEADAMVEKVKQKDFIIRHLKAEIAQITMKTAVEQKSDEDVKRKVETEYAEELSAVKKQCELLSQQNSLLSSNLSSIVKSKAKKGIRNYVDTLEAQMEALQQDHRNQWQYISAKLQRYETENRDLFVKCKILQENAFIQASSKPASESK